MDSESHETSQGPLQEAPSQSKHPPPGRRVLELLHGHWVIERQIDPGGHFSGVADFTSRSIDSLLYRESGQLELDDGTVLQGENSYVYALCKGNIEISFIQGKSKGGHFIAISFPEDQPNELPIVSVDRHVCRLDIYDATFRIESPALFTLTYVVNGPSKNYVSRSSYRRCKDEIRESR